MIIGCDYHPGFMHIKECANLADAILLPGEVAPALGIVHRPTMSANAVSNSLVITGSRKYLA
jgi:hypothetical protein